MTAATPARPRLDSVDLVRGLIMVVMALDHTRDFFGIPGQNPTNLATTTGALFFARWITHFCAPVFFLLTGTGACLSLGRKSTAELSRFLLSRGLWLIVLETIVIRCLAYQFNFDFRVTMLVVLWALGWSMITLSVLIWLPTRAIVAFGLVLVAGHNLLDGLRISSPIWNILHVPGFILNSPAHVVFVAYPLVPWLGVTALGFALGRIYTWDVDRRRAILLRIGSTMTIAFVALRASNLYGDPSRWVSQKTTVLTVVSFFNTTKYPPSLLFLLMTLGPALLLLWIADRGTPPALRPTLVIGRVPLFYYVAHFFTLHALAVAVCFARFGSAHWMFESPDLGNYPFTPPPGWGYSLPVVYLIWILLVVAMYPLCRWFAGLKQRRREVWLSYL